MAPRIPAWQAYDSIDALRQAAQDSQSALCKTLRHAGNAHIQFKGFRFRCERVASGAAERNTDNTVRLIEADFRHMTFLQALARVFALAQLTRLSASLQGRISEAGRGIREAVIDGLRVQRQALADRVFAMGTSDAPQAGDESGFFAVMTELESLHEADAIFRDTTMVAWFWTLLARAGPLPVAILDDIRRTVWSMQVPTSIEVLRNESQFRRTFVGAALRTCAADLEEIHRGLTRLSWPHDEAVDPGAHFRADGLMSLLQQIGQLPRELMRDELRAFEVRLLKPLRAQRDGSTDPEQKRALQNCTRRVTERFAHLACSLGANPANFLTGKSLPCRVSPRRWGQPAAPRGTA
jgi:hypothetical protein